MEGNLWSAAWRLSVPMMGGAALQDLFSLADMFFVGRLGEAAVAGVGASGTIMGIVFMLATGIVSGSTALVSHAVGGKRSEDAHRIAGQSILLMVLLTVMVAGLGVPFSEYALHPLAADQTVLSAGTIYLQISTGGAFAMFLTVLFSNLLRGAGDAMTPVKIIALANVINIVLDPILIFGWLGVPAMGVAGSAWATLASRLIAAAMMAWIFFVRGHEHFHLGLRDLVPHFRTIGRMLKIGVFGSGRMLMINISALALMAIVKGFGTAAQAAYCIGLRLRGVVMVPGMGFGQAAGTLVGQCIGARKEHRAARAAWITTGMYAIFCFAMTVVFWAFPRTLIAVFNSSPDVVAHGAPLLKWMSASFFGIALSMVLGRSMEGAGDTLWPMMVSAITMLVLRIPMSWGLSAAMGSVTGVWIGLSVSNIIQGGLFALAFHLGRWKIIGRGHVDAAEADAGIPSTL